jgi:hypothetical protein
VARILGSKGSNGQAVGTLEPIWELLHHGSLQKQIENWYRILVKSSKFEGDVDI